VLINRRGFPIFSLQFSLHQGKSPDGQSKRRFTSTAVVASEHLEPEDIEYERWRAERWMKVRHLPPMVVHDPWFVMRNWWGMLSFTFRGSSLKSVLGLESDREVFARYRAIRSAERQYL
jgi:anaerobic magnesium-protoporphyrin IX monomethyl ester cyclase